ncbi:MAG: redoxin domain-containing (seleno)protein, partial [bacterium]|nr:redoxin domain-containing (seleno)protein [bacterium]
NTDKSFYDPTGLPGENYRRFTETEWLWTPAVQRVKQLFRG